MHVTTRFVTFAVPIAPVAPGAWDLDVTGANAHGDRRTADRRLLWP